MVSERIAFYIDTDPFAESPEPYFLVGDTWMSISKLIEGYRRLEKLYVEEQQDHWDAENKAARARMLTSLEAERRAKAEAFVNYYKRTPAFKVHQWVLKIGRMARGYWWRVRDAWEVLRGHSID